MSANRPIVQYLVFIVIVTIIMTGCSRGNKSPEEIASDYLTYSYDSKYDKAYELLAEYEKQAISFEEFSKLEKNPGLWSQIKDVLGNNGKHIIIKAEKITDNEYNVHYTRIVVDFNAIKSMLGEDKYDDEKIEQKFNELKNNNKLLFKEQSNYIKAVKEGHSWRVDMGFAIGKKQREDYARNNEKLINEYKQCILFTNAKCERNFIVNDSIVEARVQNKGDKTIKTLAIKAFFLDKEGKPFHEELYYPILGENIKPNYAKSFTVIADGLLPEWSEKVDFEVISLEVE